MPNCPNCNNPMSFVQQYNQWYCAGCNQYNPSPAQQPPPPQPYPAYQQPAQPTAPPPQPQAQYAQPQSQYYPPQAAPVTPYPHPQPYVQQQPYPYPVAGEKNAALSIILSFLWAGLGQLYNGEVTKGIIHIVGIIALWVFAGFFFWLCVPAFLPLVFAVYSMVDAYNGAKKYNEHLRLYGRPPW